MRDTDVPPSPGRSRAAGLVLIDMLIFAFRAKPGAMRTEMLVLDGIALLFPVAVLAFLLRARRTSRACTRKNPTLPRGD